MESHSVRIIFTFVVLFSITYAKKSPCKFPAIFNFGDSNSDTGGFSAVFGQAHAPNGESYFGGPAGRYCDGRLMIDFIAERLGLPYLHPFLDAIRANFTRGANFASAGSQIRPPREVGSSPVSLNVQFYEFAFFVERSKQLNNQTHGSFGRVLPSPEDISHALITMDIGHNDLTHGDFVGKPKAEVAANITDMMDQFKKITEYIFHLGGRSFWIHNAGPIGCLAGILDYIPDINSQVDKVGCSIPHNNVARYFNRRLKEAVVWLRMKLPLAAITYVDIYAAKYSLFSQAKKLGFENPYQVCCGRGGKYNFNGTTPCGVKTTVNGRQAVVGKCKNPSRRINWDGIHYTQAANKWVYNQIVNGSFSYPSIPLKMACHRQL